MTDDNLDDVQPNKTVVQKQNEKEHNKIWNAANEAAALKAEWYGEMFIADEIRKLKK